jgi:hypothetical protein
MRAGRLTPRRSISLIGMPKTVRGDAAGTTGALSGVDQGLVENGVQGTPLTAAREQETRRLRQACGGSERAQLKNAGYDALGFLIDWHQTLGVESCRRLRISVYDYLAAVLPGLADVTIQRLPELAPAAWVKQPTT